MILKNKFVAIASLLGSYGLLSTPSFAAWSWAAPSFHGGNGMLGTDILTKLMQDWAPYNWKGECSGRASNGIDLVGTRLFEGFSTNYDHSNPVIDWTNAILCTNADEMNGFGWTVDKFDYVVLDIYDHNDQRGSWQMYGDWSPNAYKAECPDGYAVTGLAQTPVGGSATTRVLCSKISTTPTSCWVTSSDNFGWSVGAWYNDYTFFSADWNYGNYKTSCWADTYVAGVSFGTYQHNPAYLLCCQ
jgi:hypothetical protein